MTDLIIFGSVAALALAVLAYVIRRRGNGEITPAEGARFRWFFAGMVVWILVLRGLATEASHGCVVDSRELGTRGGWSFTFFECSPRLLSEGPVGIFSFFWAWAGTLLILAFLAHLVVRAVRRSPPDSKES